MTINQSILDELRKQAERQQLRNYKAIEIDCRTVLTLVSEIERSRLVELCFEATPDLTAKN